MQEYGVDGCDRCLPGHVTQMYSRQMRHSCQKVSISPGNSRLTSVVAGVFGQGHGDVPVFELDAASQP
jgi:hypothetical protein